jgi:hypothetical protein
MEGLRGGFRAADRALDATQDAVARAQVSDRRRADRAMAALARSAIFTEALLASTRARLQEIETAAKG